MPQPQRSGAPPGALPSCLRSETGPPGREPVLSPDNGPAARAMAKRHLAPTNKIPTRPTTIRALMVGCCQRHPAISPPLLQYQATEPNYWRCRAPSSPAVTTTGAESGVRQMKGDFLGRPTWPAGPAQRPTTVHGPRPTEGRHSSADLLA